MVSNSRSLAIPLETILLDSFHVALRSLMLFLTFLDLCFTSSFHSCLRVLILHLHLEVFKTSKIF